MSVVSSSDASYGAHSDVARWISRSSHGSVSVRIADWAKAVLEAAAELSVAVELNANPRRLDLSDAHVHRARELGVPVVISTDAHSPVGLSDMRFGVDQARRAWLEPKDVLNTRSAKQFRKWLARKPS